MNGDRPEEQDSRPDTTTRAPQSDAETMADAGGRGPEAAGVPDRWGEFRILRELGRGGFGCVYRALDEGLSKEIALKVVRLRDRSRLAEVMREGQMLARMRHPHIVTVHAVRQAGDEVAFVMELVEGESLEQRVVRAGQMGSEEAITIGQTLCHALAAVHRAGLLHRDIKARNVMREAGGRIVLMDFGAGRDRNVHEPGDDLTGTPLYLAPELFHGDSASPASDIYSLGVLLYFLVTGTYPVEGPTAVAIAMAHVAGSRQLLVDRRPDLPRDFIRVVERALSPSPAGRYQSAGEMLTDLDALSVRGEHNRPTSQPPTLLVAPPQSASRIAPWVAGVLGTGAFVVFVGFLSTRAYDAAFSLDRFADDSLGVYAITGVRSLVPPLIFAAMAYVAWLVFRAFWQTIAPAVPPVHRLSTRVQSSVSAAIGRRMPSDLNVLARATLLVQVLSVAVLFVVFQPILNALITPFDRADPSMWYVLHYTGGNDAKLGLVNDYQMIMPVVAVAMALGWRRLLRRTGSFAVLDKPILGAGLGIIAIVVMAVAVPFRVFYAVQDAQGYRINGERCYEIARLDDDVSLFCPDANPDQQRRNRVVPATELREELKISTPKIFEPPAADGR
ncbi:MAG TPA: serine/threonine-protein kinase [Vicinamibacterales bacterium]|nr:serine/threonine-protein kinase [Vicinamibacterales bacterium]